MTTNTSISNGSPSNSSCVPTTQIIFPPAPACGISHQSDFTDSLLKKCCGDNIEVFKFENHGCGTACNITSATTVDKWMECVGTGLHDDSQGFVEGTIWGCETKPATGNSTAPNSAPKGVGIAGLSVVAVMVAGAVVGNVL